MNSLNILSSRVIGQSSNSTRPRSQSQGEKGRETLRGDLGKSRSYSSDDFRSSVSFNPSYDGIASADDRDDEDDDDDNHHSYDEKSTLLQGAQKDGTMVTKRYTWRLITHRIFDAITETINFILSTLAAPGIYLAQCFRSDDGRYSLLTPVRKIWRTSSADSRIRSDKGASSRVEARRRSGSTRKLKPQTSRDSILSTTSESDTDKRNIKGLTTAKSQHRRNSSRTPSVDTEPFPDSNLDEKDTPRRSIRIKLHNEEVSKRQRQRRTQSADLGHPMPEGVTRVQGADSLKSPTSSSVHRITKYPHSSPIPRDLFSLRDYLLILLHRAMPGSPRKLWYWISTKLSSTHSPKAAVKLSMPMTTALTPGGPQTTLGPQHPILYYVHKRPHCDEFLRKVSKWYKLVIFTASVQEYADPVIDWLEQERKYFQARYYRQHCTFRQGAYIKDLSSVEPDLSKVMILDNSPMSYIFHEDNAVPIEGWINDPTDNGLLHLIPTFEALQYVTDVRALLALRRGEGET
ncbi:NLI interacting factor [Penicillium citrinum]|uniref:NLI interacting factor n=1 Tax=Penicillium citrinum TaxID=5077 RepID=A0A9W9TLA2_PENCI|nr:NLI interacting factor [Penicillium citrinum]KAJ5226714.1 NLI interacting factor [Penicillium citrinum]